jgi:hypothetical protein
MTAEELEEAFDEALPPKKIFDLAGGGDFAASSAEALAAANQTSGRGSPGAT